MSRTTSSPERSQAHARTVKIVTRYATVTDFIHGFCGAVDERHVLVGLTVTHEMGSTLRFSVHLADGTPVFRGVGRVVALHHTRERRAPVLARVELDALRAESRVMLQRLLLARQAVLIARASDAAAFGNDIPDYARVALPRVAPLPPPQALATGTRPAAPLLVSFGDEVAAPTLVAFGDEAVETMASTKVIVAASLMRTGAPPRVADADSEPTRLLTVPSRAKTAEARASACPAAVPSVVVSRDTERVFTSAAQPVAPRWSAARSFVTVMLASVVIAALVESALRFL